MVRREARGRSLILAAYVPVPAWPPSALEGLTSGADIMTWEDAHYADHGSDGSRLPEYAGRAGADRRRVGWASRRGGAGGGAGRGGCRALGHDRLAHRADRRH